MNITPRSKHPLLFRALAVVLLSLSFASWAHGSMVQALNEAWVWGAEDLEHPLQKRHPSFTQRGWHLWVKGLESAGYLAYLKEHHAVLRYRLISQQPEPINIRLYWLGPHATMTQLLTVKTHRDAQNRVKRMDALAQGPLTLHRIPKRCALSKLAAAQPQ